MKGPHSSFGPDTRQVCAAADRHASASWAAALDGWAAVDLPAGGPPRLHPQPSAAAAQPRLLSKPDLDTTPGVALPLRPCRWGADPGMSPSPRARRCETLATAGSSSMLAPPAQCG